jgi:hypothetical protein
MAGRLALEGRGAVAVTTHGLWEVAREVSWARSQRDRGAAFVSARVALRYGGIDAPERARTGRRFLKAVDQTGSSRTL